MPGKEHLHGCYVKGKPTALELLKVTTFVSSKPVTNHPKKAPSAQHPGRALSMRFTQEGCDTEVQPLDAGAAVRVLEWALQGEPCPSDALCAIHCLNPAHQCLCVTG